MILSVKRIGETIIKLNIYVIKNKKLKEIEERLEYRNRNQYKLKKERKKLTKKIECG
jgi:hypothetical protein